MSSQRISTVIEPASFSRSLMSVKLVAVEAWLGQLDMRHGMLYLCVTGGVAQADFFFRVDREVLMFESDMSFEWPFHSSRPELLLAP